MRWGQVSAGTEEVRVYAELRDDIEGPCIALVPQDVRCILIAGDSAVDGGEHAALKPAEWQRIGARDVLPSEEEGAACQPGSCPHPVIRHEVVRLFIYMEDIGLNGTDKVRELAIEVQMKVAVQHRFFDQHLVAAVLPRFKGELAVLVGQ